MTDEQDDQTYSLHHGDCRDVLKTLPDNSVDACVTDPPYGLSKEPDVAEVMRHWLAGDAYTHGSGGFMGRTWDSFVPGPEYWREVYRVLKPGAHLLAFSSTRTWDLLSMAIRLAGFENRDTISLEGPPAVRWYHGQGFPKSKDISAAIDQELGAERAAVGTRSNGAHNKPNGSSFSDDNYQWSNMVDITAPATDAAKQWDGWGSAMKPAWEIVLVFRKPLSEKNLAANVLAHGTGGLNIDASRITAHEGDAWEQGQHLCSSCADSAACLAKHTAPAKRASTALSSAAQTLNVRESPRPVDTYKTDIGCSSGLYQEAQGVNPTGDLSSSTSKCGKTPTGLYQKDLLSTTSTRTDLITESKTCASCGVEITSVCTTNSVATPNQGRWPSNLLLSCCGEEPHLDGCPVAELDRQSGQSQRYGDSGGASRYFYVCKASRAERDAGLGSLPVRSGGELTDRTEGSAGLNSPRAGAGRTSGGRNTHVTVKPLTLMRYLVRLVTPPGGTVVDPFMGSGTTGAAALAEGMRFVGIELDADQVETARLRIIALGIHRPTLFE